MNNFLNFSFASIYNADVLSTRWLLLLLYIIKDDPLSSLDNEVAKWIFDNSIKKMLLKHERTVILVTQKTYLVHSSDNVSTAFLFYILLELYVMFQFCIHIL